VRPEALWSASQEQLKVGWSVGTAMTVNEDDAFKRLRQNYRFLKSV
jgi:hypothetical protein